MPLQLALRIWHLYHSKIFSWRAKPFNAVYMNCKRRIRRKDKTINKPERVEPQVQTKSQKLDYQSAEWKNLFTVNLKLNLEWITIASQSWNRHNSKTITKRCHCRHCMNKDKETRWLESDGIYQIQTLRVLSIEINRNLSRHQGRQKTRVTLAWTIPFGCIPTIWFVSLWRTSPNNIIHPFRLSQSSRYLKRLRTEQGGKLRTAVSKIRERISKVSSIAGVAHNSIERFTWSRELVNKSTPLSIEETVLIASSLKLEVMESHSEHGGKTLEVQKRLIGHVSSCAYLIIGLKTLHWSILYNIKTTWWNFDRNCRNIHRGSLTSRLTTFKWYLKAFVEPSNMSPISVRAAWSVQRPFKYVLKE